MRQFLATLSGCFCLLLPGLVTAQDVVPQPTAQPPSLRQVRVTGNKELPERDIREVVSIKIGDPFTESPDQVRERIERLYRREGYAFARVQAAFDEAAGILTLAIDEGVIDEVEFEGVGPKLARTFEDEFALRSGDVFNQSRARQALDALLRPTRGAVRRDLGGGRSRAFDLIERNGRRVLIVNLREPSGRFKLAPDMGDREDWFTPVDGFVPSLGFGAAIFDHEHFNHAYVAGHVSAKLASGNIGYALGFERPLFNRTKLFVGAELRDLTATDDHWQLSNTEASLAAIGPRRSFRDYYRRRGLQLSSALRVHSHAELLFAWRGERHEPLATESDFSVWNDDDLFRPNVAAQGGHLNAFVIGASIDGPGFDRETLEATYRRHQLETPFGERLADPERSRYDIPVWRIDWTSEISTPDTLRSDFDFGRHIISGRARVQVSKRQDVGIRVIGGWSNGVLPPQRQFAIGGIGSVHGYDFKAAVGDKLQLINLEYGYGKRGGLQLLGFVDAGHVESATMSGASAPWLKGIGWGLGLGDMRIEFGYKLDKGPSASQVLVRFGRTF